MVDICGRIGWQGQHLSTGARYYHEIRAAEIRMMRIEERQLSQSIAKLIFIYTDVKQLGLDRYSKTSERW